MALSLSPVYYTWHAEYIVSSLILLTYLLTYLLTCLLMQVRANLTVMVLVLAEPRWPSGNTLAFNAEDPGSSPGPGVR